MSQHPTLSGAQHGRVRPWREVPGGLYLDSEEMGVSVRSARCASCASPSFTSVPITPGSTCRAAATRATSPASSVLWSQFFQLHFALIEIPQDAGNARQQPLFAMPPTLADEAGCSTCFVPSLPLERSCRWPTRAAVARVRAAQGHRDPSGTHAREVGSDRTRESPNR